MPPGPVKSFTNKTIRDTGTQDIRASHRQLKDPLGTNGHPTLHPLGIGGLGFHIPKVAMNPMLVCLNECLLTIYDTPLEQEGVYRKNELHYRSLQSCLRIWEEGRGKL